MIDMVTLLMTLATTRLVILVTTLMAMVFSTNVMVILLSMLAMMTVVLMRLYQLEDLSTLFKRLLSLTIR